MRLKRLLKGILLGALLAAVAVATLPWWLPTGWLKARIEREAASALGGQVRMDRLSLFWTGARLEGLRIGNPSSFGPGTLCEIPRVDASLSLTGLLSGTVRDLDVRIERPRIVLTRRADGAWNAQGLGGGGPSPGPAPSIQASPLPVAGTIRVQGGTVAVQRPGAEPLAISDLDLAVSLGTASSPVDARCALAAPQLLGGIRASVHVVSDLPTGNRIEIRELGIDAAGIAVSGKGSVDLKGALGPSLTMEAQVSGDLKSMARKTGWPLPSGQISQTLRLSGSAASASLSIEGSGQDLAHPRLQLPPVPLRDRLRLRWDGGDAAIHLEDLEVDLGPLKIRSKGPAFAQGGVLAGQGGLPERISLELSLRCAGREIPLASRFLGFRSFQADAALAGNPTNVQWSLDAALEGIRLADPSLRSDLSIPSIRVRQRAAYDAATRQLSLQAFECDSPLLTLRADGGRIGLGPETEISIAPTLEAKAEDLLALAGALVELPAGMIRPTGTYRLSGKLQGTLDNVAANLTLASSDAGLRLASGREGALGALALELCGRCDLEKKQACLDRLDLTGAGVTLAAGPARIDFSGPGAIQSKGGGLSVSVKDLGTPALFLRSLGWVPETLSATGSVSLKAEPLTFHPDDGLDATVRIEGKDLSIHGSIAEPALTIQAQAHWQPPSSTLQLKHLEIRSRTLVTQGEISLEVGGGGGADPALAADLTALTVETDSPMVKTLLASLGNLPLSVNGPLVGERIRLELAGGRLKTEGALVLDGLGLQWGTQAAPVFRKKAGQPLSITWAASTVDPFAQWTVSEMLLATEAARLVLHGDLSAAAPMKANLKLDEASVDLAKLSGLLPATASMALAGKAHPSADFSADGKGLAGKADLRLEQVRFTAGQTPPTTVDGKIRYQIAADGTDRMTVEGLTLESAGQKGSVSADLAGLLGAITGPFWVQDLAARLKGTVTAQVPEYLFDGKNAVRQIQLQLAAGNGTIRLAQADARINKGEFGATGTLDPARGHTASVRLKGVDLDLEHPGLFTFALPFLAGAGGRARFTADTAVTVLAAGADLTRMLETLKTPAVQKLVLTDGVVEGSVFLRTLADKLRDGKLATLKFRTLTQDFEVQDRKVVNHLTRMEGDFTMEIRGWTAFDGSLDHRILVLEPFTNGDSEQARILRTLNESGGIRVHGTLTDPKFDVDYDKLAKKFLQDQAKEHAKKTLEDLFKKRKK